MNSLDFSSTRYDFSKVNDSTVYSGMTVFALDKVDLEHDEVTDLSTKSAENKIYFKDPKLNTTVSLNLSDENISKLKENFGEDSLEKQKDGSYVLNSDAGKFVSSWYGDIAYKRGYLEADANNDNFLDESEKENTNSGIATKFNYVTLGNKIEKAEMSKTKNYLKYNDTSDKHNPTEMYFASSTLQDELNKTLQNDENLDGNITFDEAITYQDAVHGLKDTIRYYEQQNNIGYKSKHKNMSYAIELSSSTAGFNLIAYLEKQQELLMKELAEKLQALQKLQASDGDISVLTDDEKSLVSTMDILNTETINKAIDENSSKLGKLLNTDTSTITSNLTSNTLKDFTSKTIDTINSLNDTFTQSGSLDIRA